MQSLMKIILLYYFLINYQFVVCPTVTCDFDLDECNWKLDSIWRIYPSGSTPDTASSGPNSDHTTGNGNYARLMAAFLSESNPFGIMNTSISLKESTPFSFWYFMHGTQIGTLALRVNDQTLWEKSRRQGLPAWYQANVTLPAGLDTRITFVANRTGTGRSSDIAIDDIVMSGEAMPSTRTTRTRTTTTPRTRFNASCDFDVDKELCGWKSDTKDGWKVIHEREPNITIGPSSDYSSITRGNTDGKICMIPYEEKGTQYYCVKNRNIMQCKGSDNRLFTCRDGGFVQIRTGAFDEVGERSQFDSPTLDAFSEEGCVQFQYNIAGTDNDWLTVFVEDYWSGRLSCMWHTNGSTVPDRWVTAEAPLKLEKDGKYQIVFEARKGEGGGMGLVSLDHIVVSSSRCSGSYPIEECPYEETPTSTSMMVTTADNVKTSNDIEMTTVERETTANNIDTTTIYFNTDVSTMINTPFSTRKTSTTTSPSSTISQTTIKPTVPPKTTVTSTSRTTTLTTTPKTDEGVYPSTTTGAEPDTASRLGIILGSLVGVLVVIVISILFLKRQQLQNRFFSQPPLYQGIIPVYSNSDASDGFVRLDNIRERTTSV